jgi:dolichol kinase
MENLLNKPVLSKEMISNERLECAIYAGFIIGSTLMLIHIIFGKLALAQGTKENSRIHRVFIEFQRKSFHMIGGCINCSLYHWGMKKGLLYSAYMGDGAGPRPAGSLDAAAAFIAGCFAIWALEASRLMIPYVNKWYLQSFKGLIRDKEVDKASGVAFFIPGCVAAMMAAPSNFAIMGILFLSIGDAAASIGTAWGYIPVGTSKRRVEGSIGCAICCYLIALYLGLDSYVALVTALVVSFGEVLAEVIGLDDNLVIPMLGVLGVRIALSSQFGAMATFAFYTICTGVVLGVLVGATTSKNQGSPLKKQN